VGAAGSSLLADATQAFVKAMSSTVLVAAGVAVVGAIVALVWLPSRPAPAPEPVSVDVDEPFDIELVAAD
jgi:hypothetical protein